MDAKLSQILAAVTAAGGSLYEVGGSVRDRAMGLMPKDRDLLVTGVPVETLISVLPGTKDLVGAAFGVIKCQVDGETFDIALPRTEQAIGPGHRDFRVQCDHRLSVTDDLSRRDFTINAMARCVETGVLIDPFDGVGDLSHRIIRCVGSAQERFNEDPLRMLRALRFAARFGFDLNYRTYASISDCCYLIIRVAPERIREELSGLLAAPRGDYVKQTLGLLMDTGLMGVIFPEFIVSIGFEQRNPHHHETVDRHVFSTVANGVGMGASLNARWALLLHDIAKPGCFVLDEAGGGHFYGHEDVGAEMARAICNRLKFSADDTSSIVQLVREHDCLEVTPSSRTLRRYVAKMGANWQDGVIVRAADRAAHVGQDFEACRHWAQVTIPARVSDVALRVVGFGPANLALRGDIIAREFGMTGRDIGILKAKLAEAVVDALVANEATALIQWVKEMKANQET